jgi:2'-5' RNA ligase
MPYAVELALDPTSADAIRRAWRELDDAAITWMARSGARPHVTLGIWDVLDHGGAESELTRFTAETAPVRLTLASVGLFPGVAVFLAPTVTAELLDLHADFHRRFGHLGGRASEHYRPGAWVPHCSLATDLEPDQFGISLAIAGRLPLPLECRLIEVGIVEFRPVKQLVPRGLGGQQRAGV